MRRLRDITNQITAFIRRHWLTSLFVGLYVLVTVATLRHSAAGFASLEGGSVAWGYLSALAVDAGMALSATGLRKRFDWWLVIGLLVSAAASTFTQVLYAIAHAVVMPVAPGAQWLGEYAQWIADLRVIVLPALLPALSIVYARASKSVDEQSADDVTDLRAENERLTLDVARADADVDLARTEMARLRKLAPLLAALPQQTRAQLYARFDGNGIKGTDIAQVLDISKAAAQRGVAAARRERAEG